MRNYNMETKWVNEKKLFASNLFYYFLPGN